MPSLVVESLDEDAMNMAVQCLITGLADLEATHEVDRLNKLRVVRGLTIVLHAYTRRGFHDASTSTALIDKKTVSAL